MSELEPLAAADVAQALAMAEHCRAFREPEEAESICLDVLELDPQNQEALVLLVLARSDLLERGLPAGVDRARELLPRLASEYDRAYYGGLICERQAKYLLAQRGRRSGFVAWEWFRFALEQFEDAARLEPQRLEPTLRRNACLRLLERNRHCIPAHPEELEEHGIE